MIWAVPLEAAAVAFAIMEGMAEELLLFAALTAEERAALLVMTGTR